MEGLEKKVKGQGKKVEVSDKKWRGLTKSKGVRQWLNKKLRVQTKSGGARQKLEGPDKRWRGKTKSEVAKQNVKGLNKK